MSKVSVRIDSSRPVFIEADADSFGQVFAAMSDEEQVNVFRAIVEHMKPHRIQWDYIAIALEKDENRGVRDQLSVIFPDIAAKDAEIAKLREALTEAFQTMTSEDACNIAPILGSDNPHEHAAGLARAALKEKADG